MITLTSVTKHFGSRLAVDSLNLHVPRGVIFGLLGHNGAGKSTAIGMMLGQIHPDTGTVLLNNADVLAHRARALAHVGAIYEAPAFYDYLSGAHNLQLLCDLTGPVDPDRIRDVVHFVNLQDRIHDRVATYSHGMRQRLALAQALLPQPELLILDEPTEGLDPEGIHETRHLILKLHREWNMTILLSSHLLTEVQQICSHLAVMRQGQLLFSGDWRELARERQLVEIRVDRQPEAECGLLEAGLVSSFETSGNAHLAGNADIAGVAEWLVAHHYRIERLATAEHTLEDFYLKLTRRPAEEKP